MASYINAPNVLNHPKVIEANICNSTNYHGTYIISNASSLNLFPSYHNFIHYGIVINERILNLLKDIDVNSQKYADFEIKPSKSTINTAIQLVHKFTSLGTEIDDFTLIHEGGIMLGFKLQQEFCSIDIYNDGDLIYLNPKGIAKEITIDTIESEIAFSVESISVINSYLGILVENHKNHIDNTKFYSQILEK